MKNKGTPTSPEEKKKLPRNLYRDDGPRIFTRSPTLRWKNDKNDYSFDFCCFLDKLEP